MRIKKNGNVGIGTANPSSNLTIKNTGQHGETGVHIWNTSDGLLCRYSNDGCLYFIREQKPTMKKLHPIILIIQVLI